MSVPVWFADLRVRDGGDSLIEKVSRLFDAAGFAGIVGGGEPVAVKLHFGELGGDAFISPVLVRQVVDRVRASGGRPFLTDTNTLYRGGRFDAPAHLETAILHGFDFAVTGAPLVIADGIRGTNVRKVPVETPRFQNVLVAGDIAAVSSMLVLSHFKGHEVAGFGGAIKNLAMGCAPPQGKQEQHSARPFVIAGSCTGCGHCTEVCPVGAVTVVHSVSRIDKACCIGCFECLAHCPSHAVDVDWTTEIPEFVKRMVEYAKGVASTKAGRIGYMNFLLRITPDCDCVPWSDAPIVPDIGVLVSHDPVAIDAASYDLVCSQEALPHTRMKSGQVPGGDKFQGIFPDTDGCLQLRYGEEIGLGKKEYTLIPLE